jgi:PIN domain nuclease of toxin-antitoxin system
VVIDASALLAMLFNESGGQEVVQYLPGSIISGVNLTEILTRLVDRGMSLEEARQVVAGIPYELVPFDEEQAFLAASLRPSTRSFGLSLGDRACLALAFARNVPAVTAERIWESCDIGVQIVRIR